MGSSFAGMEARLMAINIAKLPKALRKPQLCSASGVYSVSQVRTDTDWVHSSHQSRAR